MTALEISVDPAPARGLPRISGALAIGMVVLVLLVVMAFAAPLFGVDPNRLDVVHWLKPPFAQQWFGTDAFGRDLLARIAYDARTSLLNGLSVAAVTLLAGAAIGGICGFLPLADAIVMRILDGLMAIPGVLLAIAMISAIGPSTMMIIIAITIPELPAMARLVRGVVLSVRRRLWVDAAITAGCPTHRLILWHLLPSALPLGLVQAAYVCSSAILTESVLSFLGVGTPPDVPSWGGIIGQARSQLQIAPWVILIPAIFLTLTVLLVNLIGDALRDRFDPRLHPEA